MIIALIIAIKRNTPEERLFFKRGGGHLF